MRSNEQFYLAKARKKFNNFAMSGWRKNCLLVSLVNENVVCLKGNAVIRICCTYRIIICNS